MLLHTYADNRGTACREKLSAGIFLTTWTMPDSSYLAHLDNHEPSRTPPPSNAESPLLRRLALFGGEAEIA